MRPSRPALALLIVLLTLASAAPALALAPGGPTPYQLFHPQFARSATGPSSVVYLHNLSSVSAAVTLDFYPATDAPHSHSLPTIPAYGSTHVAAQDIAMADGVYALVISADQPVESVVRTHTPGAVETLTEDRGQFGARALRLGPVDTTGLGLTLTIMNSGEVSTTATLKFLSNAGVTVKTTTSDSIPAKRFATFDGAGLPADFAGWVLVEAAEPVSGLLQLTDAATPALTEARGPLPAGANPACVARVVTHFDQGTGPRSTTRLFVGNPELTARSATVTFYDAAGSAQLTLGPYVIPAQGAHTFAPADFAALGAGLWTACATGGLFTVSELTSYDDAGAADETVFSAADANGGSLRPDAPTPPRYFRYAPRLANDASGHTVVTLHNPGPYSVDGEFYVRDAGGNTVLLLNFMVPLHGRLTYNLAEIAATGPGFTGAGEILSTGPLVAVIDDLGPRPAVTAVTPAITPGRRLQLTWPPVTLDMRGQTITVTAYNIYRSAQPYFAPGPRATPYAAAVPGPTFVDPEASVIATPGTGTYYLLRATHQGAVSEPSNRVAAFVFPLTRP